MEFKKVFTNEIKEIAGNLSSLIEKAKVDPYKPIQEPPAILSIAGVPLGSFGNFSCVTGKPKSRKTFFLSLLCAAVLDEQNIFPQMESMLKGRKVIHFDTEQSRYHTHAVARRVIDLVNKPEKTGNYEMYCLRPVADKNLEIIESVIKATDNLGLVIIDGVADLINGYNDEEQASMIVKKLLKWTAEKDIHLITVIHQNKADRYAKGHLGSYILQKAETVLEVKRENNPAISTVTPTHSRGRDIEPFSFSIDENGLPFIVDDTGKPTIKKNPHDYDLKENRELIEAVFEGYSELSWRSLSYGLIEAIKTRYNVSIGQNKIRDWIGYFKDQNMIFQKVEKGAYFLKS